MIAQKVILSNLGFSRCGVDGDGYHERERMFERHIDSMVFPITYRIEGDTLKLGHMENKSKYFAIPLKHVSLFLEELDEFAASGKKSKFTEIFADIVYKRTTTNILVESTFQGKLSIPIMKVSKFAKEALIVLSDWTK